MEKGDFKLYFETIQNIVYTGTKNNKTGHFFNLSRVDQILAACTMANNFKLTTVDGDLADFIEQEFSGTIISPLGIINDWIEIKLLTWDDVLQAVIEDWSKCNEHPQPKNETKKFEKLTGYKYAVPK